MKQIFTILLIVVIFIPTQSSAAILSVENISVSSAETLGNGDSSGAQISLDGRYVVFNSSASNLVDGDTNGFLDVFIRDRQLGTTERVSVGDSELQGDGDATSLGYISSDGRYVAFSSYATNLVEGDLNNVADIFLRDRQLETTTRINLSPLGAEADDNSTGGLISLSGEYIYFESDASNLVDGDTNDSTDFFAYEISSGEIERISVSSSETEGNSYSGGGDALLLGSTEDDRYVIFISNASNLVDGDTNGFLDVFIRDRQLGTTERVSVGDTEIESNGNSPLAYISSDGRYVTFTSYADNLVVGDTNAVMDIFVRDRVMGTTERVSLSFDGSEGDNYSAFSHITDNGRFVSFTSEATNLVADDTNNQPDGFIYDTLTHVLSRVSLTSNFDEASGGVSVSVPFVSRNGQYVVLSSDHTNIVPGDTNGVSDVFLYELDDSDGIDAAVEKVAPNDGDVDENGFIDSVEQNVSSFINTVSTNYASIVTTGECVRNDSPSASAESSLGAQDSGYDYPLGIISFEIECQNSGETATVSLYCFCENTPVEGLVARKYNENTNLYTTIDSAVISEVTIGGNRALKMVYDVVDGGTLDEDGLSNAIIIDPVGFAVAVEDDGGGIDRPSSSGSRPRRMVAVNNTPTPVSPSTPEACYVFIKNMKSGSKYGEVSKLQEVLNSKGFNSGVVDGLFGPMTDKAVKAFQSTNNLLSDGIVGPITRGVLNKCN